VELVVEQQAHLFPIQADPVRVSQLLLNLAINARDAMPNGGVLAVSTSTRTSNERKLVSLKVEDTGTGMSEQTKSKIFEPFFTTKQAGRGTGLGLATVKEIVQEASATISVESEVGRGTRFCIEFPGAETCAATEENVEAFGLSSDSLALKGRVLVCEDDAAVRAAVCDYLEAIGAEVVRCRNASEALAHAANSTPKLLISDLIMPGQDGLQLAKEMRKHHRDLKVLLITGHTEHDILNEIEAQDHIRLLRKPFTALSLMEQLRQLNVSSTA
jgi:two-component system, cell cycle sensor histidine kinase and response regulator CckA